MSERISNSIERGERQKTVYLDSAASSQKPRCVIEAQKEYLSLP